MRNAQMSGEDRNGESPVLPGLSTRAADEVRTRDPQLGKLMLYQLSYRRRDGKHSPRAVRGYP